MASIHQYRIAWTGFSGGPGYSIFNFSYPSEPGTAPNIVDALDAWANSVRTVLPSEVILTPDPGYKVFDPASGVLLDELTDAGTPDTHVGLGTGVYSGSSGACIYLKTTTVAAGRRVGGRLFIVPLAGTEYTTAGGLLSGVDTILTGASDTLKTATSTAPWSVWKRPVSGAGGVAAPITGFRVNNSGAVLRSRRG